MPAITDSMLRSWGGLTLPAVAGDLSEEGLSALDPGGDKLLALFRSAIVSELGELWAAAVATLPVSHRLYGKAAVADTFPDEPIVELMSQRRAGFPLLALHREGPATYEEHTLEKDRMTQQWRLHYILGPLDVMDRRKLADMLVAVPKVVALVIRKRGHASYESGALQFFAATGNFASVRLVNSQSGEVPFAEGSGTAWHACQMVLETVELSGWRDGAFGDVEAADYTVGVGSDEGVLPAGIVASSDHEPSL